MSPIILYSLATSIYVDVPKMFHWMFRSNFLHNAMDASLIVLYGYNRTDIECSESIFCRYSSPKKLIKDLSLSTSPSTSLIISTLFGLCTRMLAFVQLKHRLQRD